MVSGWTIVRTCRIDGTHRYSWIRNQRSLSVSRRADCYLGLVGQSYLVQAHEITDGALNEFRMRGNLDEVTDFRKALVAGQRLNGWLGR